MLQSASPSRADSYIDAIGSKDTRRGAPVPRRRSHGDSLDRAANDLSVYILYNEDYRILICRPCGFAIAPDTGIRRHLEKYHREWPLAQRRAIEAHAARLDLAAPDSIEPVDGEGRPAAAIKGLTVAAGWRCEQCGHLNVSEASMEVHCRTAHQWVKALGRKWRAVRVQTVFPSRRRRFFEVADSGGARAERMRGGGEQTALEEAAERLLEASTKR